MENKLYNKKNNNNKKEEGHKAQTEGFQESISYQRLYQFS